MRLHLNKFEFSRRNHQKGETQHYAEHIPVDQIFTVLICEKLDFNLQLINFEEIYKDIPRTMWHNLVYSIDDGVFGYISPGDGVKNPWPNHLRDPSGIFFQPSKYDCDDWGLNIFCQFFNLGLRTTQTFDFEIIRYLTEHDNIPIIETKDQSKDLKINYTVKDSK